MTVISTHMSKADSQEFKAHLGYRVRPVSKKEREMSEYMEYTTLWHQVSESKLSDIAGQ